MGRSWQQLPLTSPLALAVSGGKLYALHKSNDGAFVVSAAPLDAGLPRGDWQRVLSVPASIKPFDLAVDGHSRIYVSDPAANHVYQLGNDGKVVLTYGKLDGQVAGAYDALSLMSPGKIATWTDADGNDRLIIIEQVGPNRAAEWSVDGKLLREFLTLQTKANSGYAIDPADVHLTYIEGQGNWLTRFKMDFEKQTWTVDAVWPNVGTDPALPGIDHPKFIRVGGKAYLACSRSNNVYRQEGDRWLLSAGIIQKGTGAKTEYFMWHDANGDGKVQEEEYSNTPMAMPGHLLHYHGNQWLDDLSMVALNQGGQDVWRLAPESYDAHGNPIFAQWKKVLTDPIFEARAQKNADAIHGGNELAQQFSSDWGMADGSVENGFYVHARGGPSFSANDGAQTKISRYVPDPDGGYKLKWRTGRQAMRRLAERGDIYGAIHMHSPINGLLSIIDQSRCGVLLYTEDGLYVDTLFPDGRRYNSTVAGIYPQGGEFFAGTIVPDSISGKIYLGMGKYTPLLFEAQGWSLKDNPVKPLTTLPKTINITASQIASPPEIALSVRGGPGAARVARFSPAIGGAAMDGSMAGWESCEPVSFSADKDQTVEVRCLYDPEHLYLRWHARLGAKFQPTALEPLDRIFTHDRLADTLSLYFQGDPEAKPGATLGRAGDVRIVFGMFKDGDKLRPAALAMYPKWQGDGKPSPLTYKTPVGTAAFEHVGAVDGANLFGALDDDAKGFVIAAAIPRTALPKIPPLAGGLKTQINFSATFAGHNKFWWANSDGSASQETYDEPTEARLYPGSWAPAQFTGLDAGVVVRNWLVCGPFGGPGAENFKPDPQGPMKDAVKAFGEAGHYPPDNGKVDLNAVYSGEQVHGYWKDPGQVRWKPATIADLDTRILTGPAGQIWYAAAWLHVPEDTQLDVEFQGHAQHFYRCFLNGDLIFKGEANSKDEKLPVARKTMTLQRGWNQVLIRGYCVGYPPFRTGLVLSGPEAKLWTVKVSAKPPE